MKRILGLLIVFSFIFGLTACSNNNIPKQFLSKHKGEYSVLVVYPNGNEMKRPKFVDDLKNNNAYKILSGYNVMHLKEAQESYHFNIKKAPAYIVFNTKKLFSKQMMKVKSVPF